MSRYQHRRGQINDNALAALVHDPLFHQRIEQNRKGKGSYQRKAKHAGRDYRQDSAKPMTAIKARGFSTVLLVA